MNRNKMLLNTGDLILNGIVPDKVWTKLFSNAAVGATSITVIEATPKEYEG